MTDPTPEQKAAEAALEEAVRNSLAANDMAPGAIMTDYVVLCAAAVFDEQGRSYTEYTRLYRGDMPWHHILGLIDIHQALCRDWCVTSEDGPEQP